MRVNVNEVNTIQHEGATLRAIEINGNVYISAFDLANSLGYKRSKYLYRYYEGANALIVSVHGSVQCRGKISFIPIAIANKILTKKRHEPISVAKYLAKEEPKEEPRSFEEVFKRECEEYEWKISALEQKKTKLVERKAEAEEILARIQQYLSEADKYRR